MWGRRTAGERNRDRGGAEGGGTGGRRGQARPACLQPVGRLRGLGNVGDSTTGRGGSPDSGTTDAPPDPRRLAFPPQSCLVRWSGGPGSRVEKSR